MNAVFVLFLLVSTCLPVGLILAPLVRKLWTADKGRGRALEELFLSIGVLSAPWLFLMGMQITGNARHSDDGWLVSGLLLGVPLWGMWRLLLRLAHELIILVRRIGRSPWAGDAGWGGPLESVFGYLTLLVPAVMWFVFLVGLLDMGSPPSSR